MSLRIDCAVPIFPAVIPLIIIPTIYIQILWDIAIEKYASILPIIDINITGFLPILSDRPPSIGVEKIPNSAYNADHNVIIVYATW